MFKVILYTAWILCALVLGVVVFGGSGSYVIDQFGLNQKRSVAVYQGSGNSGVGGYKKSLNSTGTDRPPRSKPGGR